MGIIFTFKKRAVGNATMSQGMQGNVGAIRCRIRISNRAWVFTNGIRVIPLSSRCGSGTNQGRSRWACDTQVKEGYMNKPRLHPNESDLEDRMTKKSLK